MELRQSTAAWGVIAAGVVAYELLAKDDELLTDQVHRVINGENRALKWATVGLIGTTALHLCGVFDKLGLEAVDPFHQVFGRVRDACRSDC